MATWDDVRRLATALPEAVEDAPPGRTQAWRIRDKAFAWERPLRPADLRALGDGAPDGQILAVRVADEEEKQALVASEPDVFFTTPHFNGYPAVLIRLDAIEADELREVLTDAWLSRAPKRLVKQFQADTPTS